MSDLSASMIIVRPWSRKQPQEGRRQKPSQQRQGKCRGRSMLARHLSSNTHLLRQSGASTFSSSLFFLGVRICFAVLPKFPVVGPHSFSRSRTCFSKHVLRQGKSGRSARARLTTFAIRSAASRLAWLQSRSRLAGRSPLFVVCGL